VANRKDAWKIVAPLALASCGCRANYMRLARLA
jgi:hypothetical protein